MSPLLPAARAHQAERHPALGVGFRRNPLYIDPSPGAGSTFHGSHPHWDEQYEEPGLGPNPLLSTSPVDPTGVSSSSTQGPFTLPTVVQVSPVVGIPTLSLSSSSLVPTPTLSSVTSSTTSSSLPSVTTTTTFIPGTTPPQSTGLGSQGPRFGTTSLPAVTPSADSNPVLAGSTGGVKKPTGVSGGAVAAIVIVLLLVMGALAFFLFRRRRIQMRTARRATWTINAWRRPTTDASLEKGATEINPISLPDSGMAAGASATRGGEGGGGEASQPRIPIISRKTPPSYIQVLQTGEALATPPGSSSTPVRSSAPSPQPSAARTVASGLQQDAMLVRVTFVPQLPDELAITPGEKLYIRAEFDDGWALCANTRGEQGMVPLECLEGSGGQFAGFPPPLVDWHNRDSRRVSSLRLPVV
ncbi:hypothetical protein EDB86DRAFT_2881061 [Lactarius hatsudake]|nr:hypothetical protein EDB86DRAFT_2881061 [Lactarius hatsudake]